MMTMSKARERFLQAARGSTSRAQALYVGMYVGGEEPGRRRQAAAAAAEFISFRHVCFASCCVLVASVVLPQVLLA